MAFCRVVISFAFVCCAFLGASAVNPPSAKAVSAPQTTSVAISKDAAIGIVREEEKGKDGKEKTLVAPKAAQSATVDQNAKTAAVMKTKAVATVKSAGGNATVPAKRVANATAVVKVDKHG